MKKQLLSLGSALLMAFSLSSAAWGLTVETESALKVVSAPDSTLAASDYRPALAIDAQGNRFVSGLIGEDFTFAGTTVSSEVAGSNYLLKYDAQSEEVWAATFMGATITSLTTDAEGNVYVAATYGEAAMIVSPSGETELPGDATGISSAVIVKLGADGKVLDKNIWTPALHNDWGDEASALDAPRMWFEQLTFANGRLYASLVNTGVWKNESVDLTAPYNNLWGMMIMLCPKAFYVEFAEGGSLNMTKLLSSAGMVESVMDGGTATVEKPIFTIENGVMYQAASVSGTFTYAAMDGASTLYEKSNHNGYLLGKVSLDGSSSASNVWMANMSSTPIDTLEAVDGTDSIIWRDAVGGYNNYITDIAVNNGRVIVAGVFDVYSCPFSKEELPFAGVMDAFIAGVYTDLQTVAFAKATGYDEGTDKKTAYETVGAFSSQWDKIELIATASDKIDHVFQHASLLSVHPFTNEAVSSAYSDTYFPLSSVSVGRKALIALADNKGVAYFATEEVIPSGVEEIEAEVESVVANTMVSDVVTFSKAVNATLTTTTGMVLKSVENATEMSVSEYPAGYYLLVVDGAQAVKIVKL